VGTLEVHADKIQPNNTDTFTGWGMAFMKQEKFAQAREKFQKAAKFNKYNFSAIFLCAVMEIKLEMYDIAETKLAFLANVAPNENNTFEYARLKALKDDYEGAIHYAKKSLDFNPNMLSAYIILGQVYAFIYDKENSLKYFTLAEEKGLSNSNLYLEWGKALEKFGNFEQALEMLKKALEEDNEDVEVLSHMGLCLVSKKQFDEANPLLEKVLEKEPENKIIKKALGILKYETNDIQNALSSSFTSISNKIDQSINAATGSIIGSITNGNDSINSNIDELKEKQEEAHETSKGIWGTLKSLVSSIGNWFTDLMSSIGDGFKNLIEGIKALFVGEEVEECKVIKNNFTTYTHWIDDTSLSVPNYYARPVDSDGYIQLYYNSNLYRISDNFSPIKPNTEYTLYVESSPSNSLGSFIFYPSKYNTSNSKNKYRFPSMNTNKTLAPGESAIFYITSNSEDDVNYSLSSMFAYTDTDKQQGGSLYARIMLLEGHYTESEIKEKGYFKTEKEICEITNKGGLFGIIKDLGSSIVKWFNNLFDFFNNDSIDDSSSFFDGFDTNDNGGISAVITAPLVLVRKSTQSCEPLVLTSFDKDITLPCGDTLFWGRSEVASFRTVWNLLIGGSFLFFLLSKVFKTIENIKDPESDKVEVMKL